MAEKSKHGCHAQTEFLLPQESYQSIQSVWSGMKGKGHNTHRFWFVSQLSASFASVGPALPWIRA